MKTYKMFFPTHVDPYPAICTKEIGDRFMITEWLLLFLYPMKTVLWNIFCIFPK